MSAPPSDPSTGLTVFVGRVGSSVVPVIVAPGAPLKSLTARWLALRATALFCAGQGVSTAATIPTTLCLGTSGALINPQCTLADVAALLEARPVEFIRVVVEDGALSIEAPLQPLWQNAAFGQSSGARTAVARRVAESRAYDAVARHSSLALSNTTIAHILAAEARSLAALVDHHPRDPRLPGGVAASQVAGLHLERLLPGAPSSLGELHAAVDRAASSGGLARLHACFSGWLEPSPPPLPTPASENATPPLTILMAPEELLLLLRCAGLGEWADDAALLRGARLKVSHREAIRCQCPPHTYRLCTPGAPRAATLLFSPTGELRRRPRPSTLSLCGGGGSLAPDRPVRVHRAPRRRCGRSVGPPGPCHLLPREPRRVLRAPVGRAPRTAAGPPRRADGT